MKKQYTVEQVIEWAGSPIELQEMMYGKKKRESKNVLKARERGVFSFQAAKIIESLPGSKFNLYNLPVRGRAATND